MILLKRIKRFGRRSGRINVIARTVLFPTKQSPGQVWDCFASSEARNDKLTQIRKHVSAVVIVPPTRAIERIQIMHRKRGSRNWQCHRHLQPLLASQAHAPLARLIRMLVAISTSAFHAFSQRRVLTAMRHQKTNHHLTLCSGSVCHENCAPH